MKKLESDSAYDATDWYGAMRQAQRWGDEIPIGIFYENTSLPALHQLEPILDEGGPLAHRDPRVPAEIARQFVEELM